jgi:hypothetical protein
LSFEHDDPSNGWGTSTPFSFQTSAAEAVAGGLILLVGSDGTSATHATYDPATGTFSDNAPLLTLSNLQVFPTDLVVTADGSKAIAVLLAEPLNGQMGENSFYAARWSSAGGWETPMLVGDAEQGLVRHATSFSTDGSLALIWCGSDASGLPDEARLAFIPAGQQPTPAILVKQGSSISGVYVATNATGQGIVGVQLFGQPTKELIWDLDAQQITSSTPFKVDEPAQSLASFAVLPNGDTVMVHRLTNMGFGEALLHKPGQAPTVEQQLDKLYPQVIASRDDGTVFVAEQELSPSALSVRRRSPDGVWHKAQDVTLAGLPWRYLSNVSQRADGTMAMGFYAQAVSGPKHGLTVTVYR